MFKEIEKILDILNRMAKENKESDNPLQSTVILFGILYKVLDYITKLQEEKEKLFKEKLEVQKELTSRIYKAIEYIQQEDWNTEYDYKLLNILQKGSDSQ